RTVMPPANASSRTVTLNSRARSSSETISCPETMRTGSGWRAVFVTTVYGVPGAGVCATAAATHTTAVTAATRPLAFRKTNNDDTGMMDDGWPASAKATAVRRSFSEGGSRRALRADDGVRRPCSVRPSGTLIVQLGRPVSRCGRSTELERDMGLFFRKVFVTSVAVSGALAIRSAGAQRATEPTQRPATAQP